MVQITLSFFATLTPDTQQPRHMPWLYERVHTYIYIYIKWSCIECTTFLCSLLLLSGFEVRWTHIYTVAQRHATWHRFFGQYCVTHSPSSALDKAPLQAQCRTVCLVAASSSHDVPDCGLFFFFFPRSRPRTRPVQITFSSMHSGPIQK